MTLKINKCEIPKIDVITYKGTNNQLILNNLNNNENQEEDYKQMSYDDLVKMHDEKVKQMQEEKRKAAHTVGANCVMATAGFLNGALNVVEEIVDCGATVVGGIIYLRAAGIDLFLKAITGDNPHYSDAVQQGFEDFVGTQWVNGSFENFFTNTEIGKEINSNASEVMQYGNAGYQIAQTTGYVCGTVAVSCVPGAGTTKLVNAGGKAINKVANFSSKVINKSDKAASVFNKIDGVAGKVTDKIDDVAGKTINKVANFSSKVSNKSDKAASVFKKIDGVAGKVTNKIDGVAGKVTDKIDDVASKVSNKIDDVADKVTNKIDPEKVANGDVSFIDKIKKGRGASSKTAFVTTFGGSSEEAFDSGASYIEVLGYASSHAAFSSTQNAYAIGNTGKGITTVWQNGVNSGSSILFKTFLQGLYDDRDFFKRFEANGGVTGSLMSAGIGVGTSAISEGYVVPKKNKTDPARQSANNPEVKVDSSNKPNTVSEMADLLKQGSHRHTSGDNVNVSTSFSNAEQWIQTDRKTVYIVEKVLSIVNKTAKKEVVSMTEKEESDE